MARAAIARHVEQHGCGEKSTGPSETARLVNPGVISEQKPQRPGKRIPPLHPDELQLLKNLAKIPAMWPGSPTDAARLEHLVKAGYLMRDPVLKTAFNLTIRGWLVVRAAAKND